VEGLNKVCRGHAVDTHLDTTRTSGLCHILHTIPYLSSLRAYMYSKLLVAYSRPGHKMSEEASPQPTASPALFPLQPLHLAVRLRQRRVREQQILLNVPKHTIRSPPLLLLLQCEALAQLRWQLLTGAVRTAGSGLDRCHFEKARDLLLALHRAASAGRRGGLARATCR
jgi:hypothetical protein